MAHSDHRDLNMLEAEIKHLNRLNGINNRILKETRQIARQKTKVSIRNADGTSQSVMFNF